VNEHIFAAIVANDEAEALLRVEEFDGTLAFTDDLRRHAATGAASTEATAPAAAAAAAEAAAAEAATTATIAATTAAEAAAVAEATTTTAEAAAVTETAIKASAILSTEIVALVTAATTAVTLTPSIETHKIQTLVCPKFIKTNALGPWRNRPNAQNHLHAQRESLQEKWRVS
jgi:hypothetical protein